MAEGTRSGANRRDKRPLSSTSSSSSSSSSSNTDNDGDGGADGDVVDVPAKRYRTQQAPSQSQSQQQQSTALVLRRDQSTALSLVSRSKGISATLLAKDISLEGHKSQVYCCRFNADGSILASAGGDHDIILWNPFTDNKTIPPVRGVLRGHTLPILSLVWEWPSVAIDSLSSHFSTSSLPSRLYSASADCTARCWDISSETCVRSIHGHRLLVSCVDVTRSPSSLQFLSSSSPLLCTASDDGSVALWDHLRAKTPLIRLRTQYPLCSVAWSADGNFLYAGGLDNEIHCWDVRKIDEKKWKKQKSDIQKKRENSGRHFKKGEKQKEEQVGKRKHEEEENDEKKSNDSMEEEKSGVQINDGGADGELYSISAHTDTITGLRVSWEGNHLASNGMDNTVRVFDIRPFVSTSRLINTFTGATHSMEQNLLRVCWAPNDEFIAAGTEDRCVNIWHVESGIMKHRLAGHSGAVNEVDFHPQKPIVASAASDKKVMLGEIDL